MASLRRRHTEAANRLITLLHDAESQGSESANSVVIPEPHKPQFSVRFKTYLGFLAGRRDQRLAF
jgi:hypothetical protein